MNKSCCQFLLASLGAVFSVSLSAEPESRITEVTVTGHRFLEASGQYIGNTAAITAQTLGSISPAHIQQALVRVPGLNFHRNSGQEYLPAVRSPVLTGAGACGSFLTAEDGIPLRPAGFCNVNELFEAHLEIAQRIEVIRGPSIALYGSNALHGVINVVTPDLSDSKDSLSVEAGANDYYRVVGKVSSENLGAFFSGVSDGGFRDNSGVDQQKLTLRSHYATENLDVSSGLSVINLNQETAGFITGKNSFKDKQTVESNPNPEAYRDAQALRLWSRFSDQSESPAWVFTPYLRYSDMDFLQHFLPGTPLEENSQWSVGIQSVFVKDYDTGIITWGVDSEYFHGKLQQGQQVPTQGSAFLQETIPVGQHYDYVVDGTQLAPFVHWHKQLTERLSLGLGARAEWMRYDYDNQMLDGRTRDDGTTCGFGGCRYSRPADSQDDFFNFSPKLALNYQLSPNHAFYMTLARGYRVPQAVELYRLQRAQQLADLDSERLDSIELGWQRTGESYQSELILFAMKKRNVIYRDSDFFNIDDGQTRHYGLEVSLAYPLSHSLTLDIAGSYAVHKYDNSQFSSGIDINNNDVDTAPRHFGSTTITWEPEESVNVSLEWLHLGRYYTDPENLHSYQGHNLLNLQAQLKVSSRLVVNMHLTNLTDRAYAERADYTGFSGDRYLPGKPRSMLVSVKLMW